MTKRNTPLNCDLLVQEAESSERDMSNRDPFLLKPAGQDYLWGGSRLNDDFSKNIDMEPLAETWECSTHPDGLSTVASGIYEGRTLAEVLKKHPELLGSHNEAYAELPILIKLIDAKRDLSVQVHPTDEYAFVNENGQRGKTEMWYVVDATKGAQLVYGFRNTITKEQLKSSMEDGTVEKYLQKVPVHSNDVFFIKSGTVHAIGAGALIAEIQESSNLTYRLFDYNRVDKNGKKRALHTTKALDVADLRGGYEPRQPVRVMRYNNGSASEFLCRCKYFQVERVLINTERTRKLAAFSSDSTSFLVLLCVNGCGLLTDESDAVKQGNVNLRFFKGDCIFVPANSEELYLHGQAQLLKVRC